MNLLNKGFVGAYLLFAILLLSSCSDEKGAIEHQTQKTEKAEETQNTTPNATENGSENLPSFEKTKKAYKAKVNKRMANVTYNAAVKELGAVGVSETQVKCLLKDHSYATLSLKRETPEVKAAFEGCGVEMAQLKGWYD